MVKGRLEKKYKLIHNGRELSQGLLSEAGKYDECRYWFRDSMKEEKMQSTQMRLKSSMLHRRSHERSSLWYTTVTNTDCWFSRYHVHSCIIILCESWLFWFTIKWGSSKVMAVRFNPGIPTIESRPKKTRQGKSVNTILAASSRNKKKKKYRGQGR